MGIIDRYNIHAITEDFLMTELKSKLTENIMERLTAEFKANALEVVKSEVEKLSVSGVESFRDMARMRDEVKIYCEWTEGKA